MHGCGSRASGRSGDAHGCRRVAVQVSEVWLQLSTVQRQLVHHVAGAMWGSGAALNQPCAAVKLVWPFAAMLLAC